MGNNLIDVINVGLWKDKVFKSCNVAAKYIYLYILTSPNRTKLGLFYLPIEYIAYDAMNGDVDSVENVKSCLKYLEGKNLIRYDSYNEVVYIRSQIFDGVVAKGDMETVARELRRQPLTGLSKYVLEDLECQGILSVDNIAEIKSNKLIADAIELPVKELEVLRRLEDSVSDDKVSPVCIDLKEETFDAYTEASSDDVNETKSNAENMEKSNSEDDAENVLDNVADTVESKNETVSDVNNNEDNNNENADEDKHSNEVKDTNEISAETAGESEEVSSDEHKEAETEEENNESFDEEKKDSESTDENETNEEESSEEDEKDNSEEEQVKTDKEAEYELAFEEVWKHYPKRLNKTQARKSFIKCLKNKEFTVEEAIEACQNYTRFCIEENKDKQFIMYASTFFGPNKKYEDYLNKNIKEAMSVDLTHDGLDEAMKENKTAFQKFLDAFPRREGIVEAEKNFSLIVLDGKYTAEDLIVAAENYRDNCIQQKVGYNYTQRADAFLDKKKNSFVDFIHMGNATAIKAVKLYGDDDTEELPFSDDEETPFANNENVNGTNEATDNNPSTAEENISANEEVMPTDEVQGDESSTSINEATETQAQSFNTTPNTFGGSFSSIPNNSVSEENNYDNDMLADFDSEETEAVPTFSNPTPFKNWGMGFANNNNTNANTNKVNTENKSENPW